MSSEPRITTLVRIGDGYAVIIENAMLKQLNIAPDTPLDVGVVSSTIVATPIRSSAHPVPAVTRSPEH